jgi:hypothetical protein
MTRRNNVEKELLDPRSIIPLLSRAELERIIRERLNEGDEELSELIVAIKAEKKDKRSPAAIVEALMRKHQSRDYEYIEDAYDLGQDLLRLGDRAEEAVSKGEFVFAVQLLMKAIERAAPHAYEGGDDEECPILDAVEDGFDRLMGITQAPEADPVALNEIWTWALQSVDMQWARDGDSWDMSCLELAAAAARGEAELQAVLELCARFTAGPKSEWSWTYNAQRASLIAVGLLGRAGDKAARRAYIEDHLSFADIRKLAVDEAMNSHDYSRAIGLSRDGVEILRENDQSGSADEFAQRLVEALDRAGEKEEAAREFEKLVIESFSDERFAALKKRYTAQNSWTTTRDRVITALEKNHHFGALAAIYKAERMNERLLALAEKNGYIFRQYLDTIGRTYPERAACFLKNQVEQELHRTAKRSSYALFAKTIRKYGKYAGKESAEALFDSLIAAYPARRAMREEFEAARQGRY